MAQSSGFGSVDGNGETMYEELVLEPHTAEDDPRAVTIFAGMVDPI